MKISDFMTGTESGIAVEWRKMSEKDFFIKKFFFSGNKNVTHIVSDVVAGTGVPRERSKPQIS